MSAWGLRSSTDSWFEIWKGLLFVAVTSVLLWAILRRLVRHLESLQEARRQSDLRWEFALEAAGDGVWDWNLESGHVYFSERCRQLLGFGAEAANAGIDAWHARIHPDDLHAVDAAMQRHLRGETSAWVSEHRACTEDGVCKWILSRGKVVRRNARGEAVRMLGLVTDVSLRRIAEARSEAALAFAHTVLHSSPVGLVTFRFDGATLTANPAAARILDTSVEVLLAQNFRSLESWRERGLAEAADRAIGEGGEVEHATDFRTLTGRQIRLLARFVPFYHQGEPRLLLVLQDESEKHAALRELHLTRAALQASPTGWVITDANGRIEWVNPGFTRLTGYEFAEVVGRTTRMLRSGRHPREFYAHLWETIQRGEVWQGELHNRRKNGDLYHEQMVIAPVRGLHGEIEHYVAMKEDITAARELEQRLVRAQRIESIGMLASGIAHDLNNVFSPILLSIDLVRDTLGHQRRLPALDLAEQSAQRGAGIVRQLLTFARGVDGERGPVPARLLLKDIARLIAETFPRNLRLRLDFAPDVGVVNADITQLHQVLLNLALNARDAMPEGGEITIRAQNVHISEERARTTPALQPGPHVALSVSDTGPGIPAGVLEHIFEPFFTTKPRGKGTGLGLSSVHGIVASHGGVVEVSTTPGVGSEFTVLLPRIEAAAPEEEEKPAVPVFGGQSRRVLVVDDEPAILEIVSSVLRRHGFEVRVAHDGVEGLALIESASPWHLVIVDRMMPRMDGLLLAAAVRRVSPELPVILMSGLLRDPIGGDATAPTLADLGVRTVLEKPFGEDRLMVAVRREVPLAQAS